MSKFTAAAAGLLTALSFAAATSVAAHEIWIERDGTGPARIYLGEPAEPLPAGGDPEFEKLKAPKLVPASTASMTRKAGYLEVAVPAGDVRVWDDSVFAPWGEEGKKESVVYYARAGRAETTPTMPMEIAPLSANGNRFALMRDGEPVPGAVITVITPDKWSKAFTADTSGAITLPLKEKGRYLLTATQKDVGDHDTSVGNVTLLHRIATTSFVVR